MIDRDWLSTKSSTSDVPLLNNHNAIPKNVTNVNTDSTNFTASSATENSPPLTKNQRLIVSLGITGIAAYIFYTLYYTTRKGPPQIIWNTSKNLNKQTNLTNKVESENISRSTLTLVNFPQQMRKKFEKSLRPLIDNSELEILYSPVIYYHESVEVTPENISDIVRQEVLAAFEQLEGIPCAVYRSVIVIDGEPINPFWSVKEALKVSRGKILHERHCIGYTVNGGRVEILLHDLHGKFTGVESFSTASKTNLYINDVDDALRSCFGATTHTFSVSNGEELLVIDGLNSPDTLKVYEGPYSDSFSLLWLSPIPLFAMFGAALRYSRVEFDGWNRLAIPSNKGLSSFWIVQQVLSWWRGGNKQSNKDQTTLENRESEGFILEIEICQNSTSIKLEHFNILKDALRKKYNNYKIRNTINNNSKDEIEVMIVENSSFSARGDDGAVVRFCFCQEFTVFQALQESWRLTAILSCLKYDVKSFRLLTSVKSTSVATPLKFLSSSSSKLSQEFTEILSPHIPVFPRCREEMELSYPSFFSSAQYFCLLQDKNSREKGARLELGEAFKRIQNGKLHCLYYVIAEYITDDLNN